MALSTEYGWSSSPNSAPTMTGAAAPGGDIPRIHCPCTSVKYPVTSMPSQASNASANAVTTSVWLPESTPSCNSRWSDEIRSKASSSSSDGCCPRCASTAEVSHGSIVLISSAGKSGNGRDDADRCDLTTTIPPTTSPWTVRRRATSANSLRDTRWVSPSPSALRIGRMIDGS